MKQNSIFKIVAITLFGLGANFTSAQSNIGVGTNTPTEKLDVIGNIKADTIKGNVIE